MKQVIEKFIHRICEEIVMGDEADNMQEIERRQAIAHQKSA